MNSTWLHRAASGATVGLLPITPIAAQGVPRLPVSQAIEIHGGENTPVLSDPKFVRITVAPNGTVFLLQPYTPVVQRFNATGGVASNIGRKGSGPGELTLPAWMGLLSDTLWVFDVGNRRLTMWPNWGSGKAKTIPFTGSVLQGASIRSIASLSPDGTALATSGGDARLAALGEVQRLPLVRTSRDGSKILDTVAMLDLNHSIRTVEIGADRATRTSEEPFSDKSLWAASPNGKWVAVVTQPDGEANRHVSLFDAKGSRIYSARIPFARISITPSEAKAILEERYDAMIEILGERSSSAPTRSQFFDGVYMPRFRVPVSDVVVSNDGVVVLRGNDWTGKSVDYAWMTARGSFTGFVTLPRNQYVKVVSSDRFWSVIETADGGLRLVRQQVMTK